MHNEHPFMTPLTELTADELDKKYADILNRWNIASRRNMGPQVMHQLDLLLKSIENEKFKRSIIDEQQVDVILDTDPIPTPTFDINEQVGKKKRT